MGQHRFERFGDTAQQWGRAAGPGNCIRDTCRGNVAATTGPNSTVEYCNNMVKSTNRTKKKKQNKTYPIGVSDEGVGLAGSSAVVVAVYAG